MNSIVAGMNRLASHSVRTSVLIVGLMIGMTLCADYYIDNVWLHALIAVPCSMVTFVCMRPILNALFKVKI